MRRHTATFALMAGGAILCAGPALAQFGRGAGEWNTTGGDAQRSGWVRRDEKVSPASLAKPGFSMLYKVKLDAQPKQGNSLTQALVMTGYIGYRGFRSLGFVSGANDKVYAFDIDLGRIEWQKPIPGGGSSASTAACPGGVTSNVARLLPTAIPPAGGVAGGRGGGGRATGAKSDVGAPNEGSVVLKQIEAQAAARAGAAGAAGPGGPAGGRGGRGPGGERPRRVPNYVYALSSDGMLRGMYVSNGEEPEAGIKFLPPNANAQGLIVADGMAYVITSGGCGGVADGVWGLNLESKQVTSWPGKISGSSGVSLGPDGTVFVSTTTGDLVALDGKTLKVKEVYQAKQELVTSPVIFQYKDKTLVAAAAKDGSLHVVDTAKMAAPFAAPAAASATGAPLSSWEDSTGARWILVPTSSAVAAYKLVDQNGTPALVKGWTSRDITGAVGPMVLNGVVFAASAGKAGTPAVLYALDGVTGKELWNSGKSITGFLPKNGGISGGGTQLYLGTHDGTFYAFGFPVEH